MINPTGRLKRAARAGIPIVGAALILGSGALAWSAFGPSRAPNDSLVVGIGDSMNTSAIALFDGATGADGLRVFVISGNVDGLYPGGSATLKLRVRNPLDKSISVSTVTIIGVPTRSGCPASNLAAGSGLAPLNSLYTITLSPPLVITSGQTVDGPQVPITLLKAAPDACQNATFLLLYGGTATSADDDNDFDDGQTDDDNQSDEP
jgi:hypothetical protein